MGGNGGGMKYFGQLGRGGAKMLTVHAGGGTKTFRVILPSNMHVTTRCHLSERRYFSQIVQN